MEVKFLFKTFAQLNEAVVNCRLCPRLVAFREEVPARAAYADQLYWRKPVPGFGDTKGWLLILGLAPAAHGGNRTGRLFTGDASARFLMQALYDEGFANQPLSESRDDGLILHDAYMTAVVKCVPPKDKPTSQECLNCSRYLHAEIAMLDNLSAVLALGKLAFDAFRHYAKLRGVDTRPMRFSHGAYITTPEFPTLYASYHPSPQNTNTGKLNQSMLRTVLQNIRHNYNTKKIN